MSRHVDDETGEVRTVPQYDRIDVSLLHRIAEQCGANDFREWCRWNDRRR